MKPQALLLIVFGLLMGPGYFAFTEYLSGRPGQSFTLTERASRWPLPDGSILRVRGGLAYKPIPLELTPADNGYRLRFEFNVVDGPADAANAYQVSLTQGDLGVVERSLQVKGSGNVTVTLDRLEVLYPDSYLLLVEEVGPPALSVSDIKLQLYTGVEKPRVWIAWSGLVMLLFGIGMQVREVLVRPRHG